MGIDDFGRILKASRSTSFEYEVDWVVVGVVWPAVPSPEMLASTGVVALLEIDDGGDEISESESTDNDEPKESTPPSP